MNELNVSQKITVATRDQAWEAANKIFPTDYEKDEASSQRAGYDIYRHHELNHYARICDLGNRLEVLTGEWGENVTNIWIEPEIIKNMGTKMSEGDYRRLCGFPGSHEWAITEAEAKIYVNRFFGFEVGRIEIIDTAETFRSNGRIVETHQTYKRTPQYCATDYNYIRFNANNWQYEMINGQLHQYWN